MSEIIERVKQTLKEGLDQIDKIAIKHGIEIWKPVEGYPNYAVSSFGNVKNVITGKFLKPANDTNGYYVISMCNNGNCRTLNIHRLVAKAFLINSSEKKQVDHIDNDRKNNKVLNLRWCSISENGMNKSLSSKNSSGVKGVRWNKRHKKWYAQIRLNGKHMHLGCYETIEEATAARQLKAKEVFGEFVNACEL